MADFEIFENEVSDICDEPICFRHQPDHARGHVQRDLLLLFRQVHAAVPGRGVRRQPASGAGAGSKAKLGEINGVTASRRRSRTGPSPWTASSTTSTRMAPTPTCRSHLRSGAAAGHKSSRAELRLDVRLPLQPGRATTDVDPLSPTGATYGTEIDNIITSNGFFPIPLGVDG